MGKSCNFSVGAQVHVAKHIPDVTLSMQVPTAWKFVAGDQLDAQLFVLATAGVSCVSNFKGRNVVNKSMSVCSGVPVGCTAVRNIDEGSKASCE